MRITNLLESKTLLERQLSSSRLILAESCDGLTNEQRTIVEGYYNEILPLIEASLTADQIQQLFGNVEKAATDAGGNRTMLGKSKDVVDKVDEIINKAGKWLQDTTPVKAFDQKFEQLKGTIGAKFPGLDKNLTAMGTWAKENPGKTAAIVGVLTAIASLAGGPVGGAIAGQVLRGTVELLKGEKLSTAIGKGIKTAALGYLSGKAFEMLGKFAEGMRLKSMSFGPENAGFEEITFGASKIRSGPGWEWTEQLEGVDIIVDPEMASAVKAAQNLLRMGGDAALEGFDQLKGVADIINSQDYKDMIVNTLEISRQELVNNDSLLNFIKAAKTGLQAASQGAVAAAGVASDGKKESVSRRQRPLSEGQVYMVFNRVVQLNEGPMDAIKGAASKAMDWAKTKGTNLTTKVTADKLNSAWKKAGSPTDSEEVSKIIGDAGVDPAIVKQVFTDLKLPQGKQSAAPDIEQVKQMISKLPVDRKARLLKYLMKMPADAPAANPAPEKDSLGRTEPTMN
jgi:hypothetical protein